MRGYDWWKGKTRVFQSNDVDATAESIARGFHYHKSFQHVRDRGENTHTPCSSLPSPFTNKHVNIQITGDIVPLPVSMKIDDTILITFVVWLFVIPVIECHWSPRRLPQICTFRCFISCPEPHGAAQIVVASRGDKTILVCNNQTSSLQITGPVSISNKTSYRESLEGAWSGVKMFISLWDLTGTSAAVLPKCLPNFRAIAQF